MVKVLVKKVRGASAQMPQYMTSDSSGMDLFACLNEGEITLAPGGWQLIPTGIAVAIPKGYEGQVRPRSGLALKHGVSVLNGPGTVDADYRGEIRVILINLGTQPFLVRDGERIAQFVIQQVCHVELEEVNELPETTRGEGGFGHTGL
jgi:dUTP pyrophosphatase